jgi:hypothetical protein
VHAANPIATTIGTDTGKFQSVAGVREHSCRRSHACVSVEDDAAKYMG